MHQRVRGEYLERGADTTEGIGARAIETEVRKEMLGRWGIESEV